MPLEREIWKSDIIGGLYKGNEFLLKSKDESSNVLSGRVVHLPQAGVGSGIVKNRTTLPATVNRRSDTEVTYVLDEYTSNPILIPNIETIQLSYDKRASILEEDMSTIRQVTADWMLRIWAPTMAAQIIRTTGAAVSAKAAGATGTRKGLSKDDLRNARLKLNKQNIPKEGRVALIPSDMMDVLLSDSDLLKRDYAGELDLKGGVIARLFGFELMERSTVQNYAEAATPTPKDPDAASAATDQASALCWHPMCVERALGTVDMFEQLNAPTYYGDIYSLLLMMGGRQRRGDGNGIVGIIEAN